MWLGSILEWFVGSWTWWVVLRGGMPFEMNGKAILGEREEWW